MNILQRLQRDTKIDAKTGCWLYIKYTHVSGHAQANYNGKHYKVSRLSAHLHLGLDLNNPLQFALHKQICPNPNCWNPDHLYIGTRVENITDKLATFLPKEFCKNGHELTENNVYIGSNKGRNCRICKKENANKSYEKRKNLIESIKQNIKETI